jgi:hypothetical protein
MPLYATIEQPPRPPQGSLQLTEIKSLRPLRETKMKF